MTSKIADNLGEEFESFSEPEAIETGRLKDGRFSVRADGGLFDCYLHCGEPKTRIFCLLNGAVDRKRRPLPQFHRWSWSDSFPGHFLCVADPTLYLDDELRLGWYLGTRETDWSRTLARIVERIASQLGVPSSEIVFYGSSGGGFAAMVLASRIAGAGAIAINPQTHVLRYRVRPVRAMLDVCFPGTGVQTFPEDLAEDRLSAIARCRASGATRIVVAQNRTDDFHLVDHFTPFCEALDVPREGGVASARTRASVLFEGPGGHFGAESREMVEELIGAYDSLRPLPPWEAAVDLRSLFLYVPGDPVANVASLEERGFVAQGRDELGPWPLGRPVDWGADPFADRNWQFHLHAWRMVDHYLRAHADTGHERYTRAALTLVLDWGDWHLRQGRTADASWSDMAAGLRAQKLAYLMSMAAGGELALAPDEEVGLCSLWEVHADYLSQPHNLHYNNHSLAHLHGLHALARVWPGHRRTEALVNFVQNEMPRVWSSQFDEHGVHRENSPDYHVLSLALLRRYLRSGWYGPEYGLEDLLRKAQAVERWMRLPDGRTVPCGDTDGGADNWSPGQLTPPTETFSDFETFCRSGYGVVRSSFATPPERASMLHFMGAFASRVHKHADDLSVLWYEHGSDILVDAGKYGYHSDRFRSYCVHTRAHNTVEIDGATYSRADADAHGGAVERIEPREWGFELRGRRHHGQFGVAHTRRLLFRPGAWLVLIDELDSEAEHAYTQWLHLAPRFSMTRSEQGFYDDASGMKLCVASFSTSTGELDQAHIRGQTAPRVQGWISRGYRQVEENDAIGITVHGHHALITTALSLGDQRMPAGRISKDGSSLGVVLWAHGDRFEIDLEPDERVQVRCH